MGLDAEDADGEAPGRGGGRPSAQALLATGAMVNILRVDGAQLEGIHYLRAFGNSDSIRDDVADAERVVLVGGSYIGAEVAASLTEMGKRCTIVEIEQVLMSRALRRRRSAGTSTSCSSRRGSRSSAGRRSRRSRATSGCSAVLTECGRELDCDAVVVGAGVRPDTMLAGRAGLEVDDGIVCDCGLETSVEGIFAAGDCCSYESELHGRRLRIEHWDVAFHQGRHAARGMLGDKRALPRRPLLLQRPLRLGGARVRRPRRALGRRDLARRPRERRVLRLVPRRTTASSPRCRSAAPRICRTPAA